MIALLASMAQELSVLSGLEKTGTRRVGCFEFGLYTLAGHEACAAVVGTGKCSAAAAAQAAILAFSPSLVINIGTAGSVDAAVRSKDAIIATETIQHDFDISAFGYQRGELPELHAIALASDAAFLAAARQADLSGFRVHFGRMLTGDVIVTGQYVVEHNLDEFAALSADMESGAIGQVCAMNGVALAAVRSISDEGDEDRGAQFTKNIGDVAEINGAVLLRILAAYPKA
jgi:adenosylhomocysteine nucleosidase